VLLLLLLRRRRQLPLLLLLLEQEVAQAPSRVEILWVGGCDQPPLCEKGQLQMSVRIWSKEDPQFISTEESGYSRSSRHSVKLASCKLYTSLNHPCIIRGPALPDPRITDDSLMSHKGLLCGKKPLRPFKTSQEATGV